MIEPHNPNLELLRVVAARLGTLRDEVVFVGGAVTRAGDQPMGWIALEYKRRG